MGSTTVIGLIALSCFIILLILKMSDEEEAIYIGEDDSDNKIYPNLIVSTPTVSSSESEGNREFRVVIREFQILKESYIVNTETQIYKVEIFLNDKEYQTVHRRFSDFEFLFDIIQQNYPGLIIPGFQQKSLFSYFEAKISHFQKSIIHMRMNFLCRFFTKILNIPMLETSKELENFLAGDQMFQIFKKSNLGNIKKKGFIGGWLTSAGNIFKTKKVDSKYEKFMEEGVNLLKELEKLESELVKYPNSISQEVELAQGLKQSNPQIFQMHPLSRNFDKEIELATQYGEIMLNIVDELVYCQLDVKFYVSIIEKRYELKQTGEHKVVEMLEKTFEAQKDGFLQMIRSQLKNVRKYLKEQVVEYKKKAQQVWRV